MIAQLAGLVLAFTSLGPCTAGIVTHYGIGYQGQQMGCVGSGLYDTNNPVIIAASPASGYDCGDKIIVIGPAGWIIGYRVDTCPGCAWNQLDLSEAGIAIVCGHGAGRCEVKHMEVPR